MKPNQTMEERFDELGLGIVEPRDVSTQPKMEDYVAEILDFIRSEKEFSAREAEERVLKDVVEKLDTYYFHLGMPREAGYMPVEIVKGLARLKGINLTANQENT